MRMSRLSVLVLAALAFILGGCFQRGPQYVQYQYVPPPQPATTPMASAGPSVVYAAPNAPAPAYQVPVAAPGYQTPTAQAYPTVSAQPAPSAKGPTPRGFFAMNLGGPFAQAPAYGAPPVYATPAPAPIYSSPCGAQGCGAAAPAAASAYGYAGYPQASFETPYLLDAGDRLRITVFGQDGLTNAYAVDAAGNVTLPLVGTLPARGMTTEQLSYSLSERLKQGYIREPKVAIEVEAYRPFFIHGEVATPGQFAYVANMTVENAIAIAGGFGPRADRGKVTVSRTVGGQTTRATVGLSYPLRPGDTLRIGERWF
jgi:polysaccharide export outer membrane protein